MIDNEPVGEEHNLKDIDRDINDSTLKLAYNTNHVVYPLNHLKVHKRATDS